MALDLTIMALVQTLITDLHMNTTIMVLTKLSALDLDLALTIVVLMILIVLDLTMDQAPCQDPTMIMDLVLTMMALDHTTVDHMIHMDLDLGRTIVDQAPFMDLAHS